MRNRPIISNFQTFKFQQFFFAIHIFRLFFFRLFLKFVKFLTFNFWGPKYRVPRWVRTFKNFQTPGVLKFSYFFLKYIWIYLFIDFLGFLYILDLLTHTMMTHQIWLIICFSDLVDFLFTWHLLIYSSVFIFLNIYCSVYLMFFKRQFCKNSKKCKISSNTEFPPLSNESKIGTI